MARYVFTWELGQGLGHLVRYRELIQALLSDGHELTYLARDASRVRLVNPQASLNIREIQPEFCEPGRRIIDPQAASYATLLLNCGFNDAPRLTNRLKNWVTHLRALRPDCVICDHSPTAVLACKVLGLPTVVSGNGFTVPPAENPFKLFQYWRFAANSQGARYDERVLAVVQEALKAFPDSPRLTNASELVQGDASWLMTFGELDCYGRRDNGNYLGTFVSEDFGVNFSWPKAGGPRVFAYLHGPKAIDEIANWVATNDASLCLYARRLTAGQLSRFPANNTLIAESAVSLVQVCREADLAITNGGSNSLATLALAGIPQLAIVRSIENYMEARRLELLGCGLIASGPQYESVETKLTALCQDRDFARAASGLARKYHAQSSTTQCRVLVNQLRELTIRTGA